MERHIRPKRRRTRRGSVLLEIVISAGLFTIIMLSAMAMIESGHRASESTLQVVAAEDLGQQMLFRIENELANASGYEPETDLTAPVLQGETQTIQVTSTLGFPPRGTLILDRGKASEERVTYTTLGSLTTFQDIQRGVQCSAPVPHPLYEKSPESPSVTWSGLAVPISEQVNPTAGSFDGRSLEENGPVFFRGDGTGFSYRKPIDPAGGNNFLNGDDLFWGAKLPAIGQSVNGWVAFTYVPKTTFDEDVANHDLNGDGDQVDVFDVGQIRRLTWDTTNNTRIEDIAMGPSRLIQEQCNWGGDLDADGFDDPIFLWDPATNELHVRFHIVGTSNEFPITRLVESVTYLRNEPEL